MINTQILGIALIGIILVALLLVLLVWRSRKGKGRNKSTLTPLPWGQIVEIPDADARYLAMGEFVTHKQINEGYEALSESERVIYHVFTLEGDVNLGGFELLFYGSGGDYILEAVESLRRIGSTTTLALVSRAIGVFGPIPPSSDREARQAQVDALPEAASDEWERLDQAFFNPEESLADLVVNYIERQG